VHQIFDALESYVSCTYIKIKDVHFTRSKNIANSKWYSN